MVLQLSVIKLAITIIKFSLDLTSSSSSKLEGDNDWIHAAEKQADTQDKLNVETDLGLGCVKIHTEECGCWKIRSDWVVRCCSVLIEVMLIVVLMVCFWWCLSCCGISIAVTEVATNTGCISEWKICVAMKRLSYSSCFDWFFRPRSCS